MHKSRGNVIDPLDVIKEHGAEALRYYATTCSLGEDNAVRNQDFVRGERFARKFHNIQNFLGSVLGKNAPPAERPGTLYDADHWILERYASTIDQVTQLMEQYQYAPAMKMIESFAWLELADNYLEIVKARAYEGDEAAGWTLATIGLGLAQLLAPFLPHVTEEAYQNHHKGRVGAESIHLTSWPEPPETDRTAAERGRLVKDVVAAVRNHKSSKGMPLNAPLKRVEVFAAADADAIEANATDLKGSLQIETLTVAHAGGRLEKTVVAVKPVYAKIGRKTSRIDARSPTRQGARGRRHRRSRRKRRHRRAGQRVRRDPGGLRARGRRRRRRARRTVHGDDCGLGALRASRLSTGSIPAMANTNKSK
jgi:valyl-tRNA synthetase